MMNEIKKVVPNAKLVYNNSPSFNWTLNFRQQVFDAWEQDGKDLTQYEKDDLMAIKSSFSYCVKSLPSCSHASKTCCLKLRVQLNDGLLL